jgi:hypothetical protein
MSRLAHTKPGDKLADAICDAIQRYMPMHILEIGSSDGTGSTKVIAEAVKWSKAQMYCIEMCSERFIDLKINTAQYWFVHSYNVPSVGAYGMFERDYIDKYKERFPDDTLWKVMKMEDIYAWYDNTVTEIGLKKIQDGIAHIKDEHNLKHFDMVFIDGSPFTAMEELRQVYGSDVIVLDDTMDLKCRSCLEVMMDDTNYELIERQDDYRNGFAIFKKR